MENRTKPGTIEAGKDGKQWIYIGGDDSNPDNWKPVNPITLPSMEQSMQEELGQRNALERFNAAWGTAGLDMPALGLKRAITGGLTPQEQQRNELNKQIMSSGIAGKLGSVGGVVSTLAAPSGAVSKLAQAASSGSARLALELGGQGALGYLYGAMSTPDAPRSGASAGAVGGVIGAGIGEAIRGIARPAVASAAAKLQQEGVPITPGQGTHNPQSFWRWVEERARVGATTVARRHQEALQKWSANVVNKVLPPGARPLTPGPNLIKEAAQSFDDAYDAAVAAHATPSAMPRPIIQDAQFKDALGKLYKQYSSKMLPDQVREFGQRLTWLRKQFVSDAIGARGLKDVRFQLQEAATKAYNGGHGALGEAYAEMGGTLNELMRRRAPKLAADLAAIDTKYAQWLRVQAAAGKVGVEEGVFTPAQLLSSIREMDKTAQKRAFARGTTVSTLRDMADEGKRVLGMTIPAIGPGTAERLVVPLAAQQPQAVIPYLAAQLGYSTPVQSTLMGRTAAQRFMAPGVGMLAPAAIAEREELIKRGLLGPDY